MRGVFSPGCLGGDLLAPPSGEIVRERGTALTSVLQHTPQCLAMKLHTRLIKVWSTESLNPLRSRVQIKQRMAESLRIRQTICNYRCNRKKYAEAPGNRVGPRPSLGDKYRQELSPTYFHTDTTPLDDQRCLQNRRQKGRSQAHNMGMHKTKHKE